MNLSGYDKRLVNAVFALAIEIFIMCIFAGCGAKTGYNPNLSDLGGVYSSLYSDLDLSIEISGRLSEDSRMPQESADREALAEAEEIDYNGMKYPKETGEKAGSGVNTADASENIALSNRLLRWGIARRPDNQTPAADPGAPELLKKYGGVYIGDTSRKVIYLTFDEGYENGYTPLILDTLRDNNVKAVFFITGPYLNKHQDLVRRMVEEGHMVGNHTIHHPSLPELDDASLEEEVLGLERAFKEKFNQDMKFLRPPKGEYSERTLAITQKLGYCNLFWSFAYDDWYRDKIRGAEYARNIVMRNIHNGAVLLLHAVSKDNAEALDSIIKELKQSGYSIGDPQELLPPEKAGD